MFVVGIILIVIGLCAIIGVSFFHLLFAAILIAIGIRLITRRSWHDSWHWHHHYGDNPHRVSATDDRIDEVAVFSPLTKSYTTEHFKGGKIVMVFSGGEIDLTNVKTDAAAIDLEVSSVFSGIEITVPKDWKVVSVANAFAGGVDIHQALGGDGPVTLTIRGNAVFGGIEVKK